MRYSVNIIQHCDEFLSIGAFVRIQRHVEILHTSRNIIGIQLVINTSLVKKLTSGKANYRQDKEFPRSHHVH